MSLDIAAMVLLAAVLHAGWNAVVKAGGDRLLTMATVLGVGSLGAALAAPFVAPPAPESWPYILLSTVIHLGYYFFLLQAYRVGDLSHVYPIARGLAPLLVAVGAMIWVGERVTPFQLGGMLVISTAILALALDRGASERRDWRPFLFGVGTAFFIAAYTLTDGLGVRVSESSLGYILWLFIFDGVPLGIFAILRRRGRVVRHLRLNWRTEVTGGAMCAAAYGLAISALAVAPMAFVSALRETSVVFAAIFGAMMLGEPFGKKRITVAVTVAIGIAVLNLAG